ncbi:MAG: hypothetical protein IPM38_13790 [Ignavibacteria bacterium]|nr:hypothetical protein [Ignavibacteria bacterium]
MKFISDDRIHLYLINPHLLSDDEIAIINFNLKESREFRDYFEELKNVYQELNLEKKKNIIELFPQKFISDFEILLVAEQEKLHTGLKHVGSHVSADNLLLVRIFRDYSKGEYQLHLLSEGETTDTANGVLELKELNHYFFADEKGIIRTSENIQFKNYHLHLYIPAGLFELHKLESSGKVEIRSLISNPEIKVEMKGNVILLTSTGNLKQMRMKVFLDDWEISDIDQGSDKNIKHNVNEDIKFPLRLIIIVYP